MSKSSEAVKRWRARTKERIIRGFGGPTCCVCGRTFPAPAFDFHHLDPDSKDFSFGSVRSGCLAWEKVATEMAKCVQVCATCHRLVHSGDMTVPENAPRFDNKKAKPDRPSKKLVPCPVCGVPCKGKYCSRGCQATGARRTQRPNRDILAGLVAKHSVETVGRMYGVSGNAIRKWLKTSISS